MYDCIDSVFSTGQIHIFTSGNHTKYSVSKVNKAGVAFKDISVWIGIKCVITSLRQARAMQGYSELKVT